MQPLDRKRQIIKKGGNSAIPRCTKAIPLSIQCEGGTTIRQFMYFGTVWKHNFIKMEDFKTVRFTPCKIVKMILYIKISNLSNLFLERLWIFWSNYLQL